MDILLVLSKFFKATIRTPLVVNLNITLPILIVKLILFFFYVLFFLCLLRFLKYFFYRFSSYFSSEGFSRIFYKVTLVLLINMNIGFSPVPFLF